METTDGDKDFAGRLFARPFLKTDLGAFKGLGFGLAGTIGGQEGSLRSFVSPGQQRFFAYRSRAGTNAATANVSADGEHWRLVPQAYYYWGPLGIFGEYAISDQCLKVTDGGPGTFGRVKNTGWQVTISYSPDW